MRRSAIPLAIVAALTLAACFSGGRAASGQPGPGKEAILPDGRALNFRCSGSGSPTVLLESGFGVGAAGWGRTQPQLAKITRVCSYDRAGYGFSAPGPEPRDGMAIARDLDQGLAAAEIEGPYVVVGHSAGGLYARLFAARRPGEVLGLVLLDPTVEHLAPPGRDGLDGIRRRLQRCLATAETSPSPPRDHPKWEGCISAQADAQAVERARRPATWRGQLSELDSIFGRTSEQVNRLGGLLADVPAYVITASDTAAAAPSIGYDTRQSLWTLQQVRLALEFEHGYQRTILASHLIQNDRPEVVAETVLAMVKAVRAGKPPEPLPVSETAPLEGDAGFPEPPR
jgi:pimeloyl-ACP methyl ester carboxylesterase